MSQYNYIYFGDMQQGDRAATGLEITAYLATIPPDFNDGLAIVSTGTPIINGTYALNSQAVIAEVLYIQVAIAAGHPQFSNGETTKQWPELNGALQTFTVPNFISMAQACAEYVDAVLGQIVVLRAGGTPVWPTQPITIP